MRSSPAPSRSTRRSSNEPLGPRDDDYYDDDAEGGKKLFRRRR